MTSRAAPLFQTTLVLTSLFLPGCASTPNMPTAIGSTQIRRLVILGIHSDKYVAQEYSERYSAAVWYQEPQDLAAKSLEWVLGSRKGLSRAEAKLRKEIRSMNNTQGEWTLIVPETAVAFVLHTLQHMASASLSECSGSIWLIDTTHEPAMESEIARISTGSFRVVYQSN